MEILIVIPARGGSKGIPRKNLRMLNNKPLLYYSVTNALNSKFPVDVYVSSDDDEILNSAANFGSKTHKRNPSFAQDNTTLDPVIYDCLINAEKCESKRYDIIITMQPTSPLLTSFKIDEAIEKMIKTDSIDTIIAAKDSTHLSWRKENNTYKPNYKERLNRQYLTPSYTETGGFLMTRRHIITESNRIGENVDLALLSNGEEIDIDTYEDWNLCDYYLKRKHIVFVVTGNKILGLGHVYNTLLIANDILNHKVTFLVDKNSQLAFDIIKSKNYNVLLQQHDSIIDDIKELNPYVIVNDQLDTKLPYILALKKLNYKVINFEDLGEGSQKADVVVNAIYPERKAIPNHYYGQDYFILRDEFIFSNEKTITPNINSILITFGGVDPNNYTLKVIKSIYSYCEKMNIEIVVVAGFGYNKYDTISTFKNIKIKQNISNISDYMLNADLIFTSAGRTVYEIASIGTPSIVLAQNERELTHFFASSTYGFLNLGLGTKITEGQLLLKFEALVANIDERKKMNVLMLKQDLKSGRQKVLKLIQNMIQD